MGASYGLKGLFLMDFGCLPSRGMWSTFGMEWNEEFRLMEETKLLQEAANPYNLQRKEQFEAWFQAMEPLSEDERYSLSCQLSPGSSGPDRFSSSSRTRRTGHLPAQGWVSVRTSSG
ncbi:PREDICTED: ral guanine nucleotide dissociation stimulator-like [Ceratotherium simum simum]|uniref:Ral guanine nucleotide dissociation stimulator-like n=1 Tax=Ceratotherium simum simum TaxID=73337 RepID=A0ABM1D841_CERSS|nr:PREDICTED: ral guanine nucleotide dissociation stimulator-like [Ceratotherium simum simum]